MECVALMVIHDIGIEKYMPVDIIIQDNILPENNAQDIMKMVNICNKHNQDKDIVFIDMYGLIYDDKLEMWEVFNDI
jgi:hypothetical protein